MDPNVSFITLGVPDLAAARRFYVEGLGWEPTFEVEDDVVMIQVAPGQLLGLWGAENLETDAGSQRGAPPDEWRGTGLTLAQNVGSEEEVRAIHDRAAAAGATILKEPMASPDFGGLHFHFADPAGFRWEIAYNPGWRVDEDGSVHIGPSS